MGDFLTGSRPIALAVPGRTTPNTVGLLPFSERAKRWKGGEAIESNRRWFQDHVREVVMEPWLVEGSHTRVCVKEERRTSMKRRSKNFGNNVKAFRQKSDLTQGELADKVGVRRETILYLEKGKYNPSLKLAHAIAKALGTNICELFIFED